MRICCLYYHQNGFISLERQFESKVWNIDKSMIILSFNRNCFYDMLSKVHKTTVALAQTNVWFPKANEFDGEKNSGEWLNHLLDFNTWNVFKKMFWRTTWDKNKANKKMFQYFYFGWAFRFYYYHAWAMGVDVAEWYW